MMKSRFPGLETRPLWNSGWGNLSVPLVTLLGRRRRGGALKPGCELLFGPEAWLGSGRGRVTLHLSADCMVEGNSLVRHYRFFQPDLSVQTLARTSLIGLKCEVRRPCGVRGAWGVRVGSAHSACFCLLWCGRVGLRLWSRSEFQSCSFLVSRP